MDPTAESIQKTFETIWGPHGTYRNGSSGERYVPRLLGLVPPSAVINDYGSGTGRAALKLFKAGFGVHMVDIAKNALEPEAAALLDGEKFTWTHAPLWDLPVTFPFAEWGYCVSVLQTIPPDKLDDALRCIFLTCDNLFVSVMGWQEEYSGVPVHPIVEDRVWWKERLGKWWDFVEDVPNPEDKRRHDFICRGNWNG